MEHLLLHCCKSQSLWNIIFDLFRVNWVLGNLVKDVFIGLAPKGYGQDNEKNMGGCSFELILDSLETKK